MPRDKFEPCGIGWADEPQDPMLTFMVAGPSFA